MVLYIQGIMSILSLISFIILVNIYLYLDQIKDCKCFISNEKGEQQVDVEFLKFYQILEIVSLFIFISFLFLYENNMRGGSGNNKRKNSGLMLFITLSLFILMVISGYVSYNSFLFYQNVNNNCKCANKWQQYFIYLQGIFHSVYFLRLLFTFILVLILIISGFFLRF
jgi:hypothetical protein